MWDESIVKKHRESYSVEHYFGRGGLEDTLKQIGFSRIEIYPILRSYFARNLFARGITNGFHYNYVQSILGYFLLKREEKNPSFHKGIFLVARCSK
jgi:hypothetical protein